MKLASKLILLFVIAVIAVTAMASYFTSPLNEFDFQSRYGWLAALFSIAAMGLLSIGVFMIAGVRWIARPLERLTEKMERVGQGDFSSDLNTDSDDELGQLAAAVNRMCDQLRQQQATIADETNQRIEAIELLRHADRLKTVGELAAGLAHEVGTPLNVISGRAEMILTDQSSSTASTVKHATAIKAESDRISSIIQKLLDFARQRPGKKSRLDLREVIAHSVEMIRPLAEKNRVDVSVDLPDSPAESSFDFNQIQQALMNLIDNSIDASAEQQTVSVTLQLSEFPKNKPDDAESQSMWEIRVVDQGAGIEKSDQGNIFQPFFTTKEVGSGTGLGLSIVHGIVKEHAGTLHCESAIDHGTTITIRLPVA